GDDQSRICQGFQHRVCQRCFLGFQNQFVEFCSATGIGCRCLIIKLGETQENFAGDGALFTCKLVGENSLGRFCNSAVYATGGSVAAQCHATTASSLPSL